MSIMINGNGDGLSIMRGDVEYDGTLIPCRPGCKYCEGEGHMHWEVSMDEREGPRCTFNMRIWQGSGTPCRRELGHEGLHRVADLWVNDQRQIISRPDGKEA